MSNVSGAVVAVGLLCAPSIIYIVRSPIKPNLREALENISGWLLAFYFLGSILGLGTYLFPPQDRREIGSILLLVTWVGGCGYAWRLTEKERKEHRR